eukprot:765075-Hanusia_phi.AAC.4
MYLSCAAGHDLFPARGQHSDLSATSTQPVSRSPSPGRDFFLEAATRLSGASDVGDSQRLAEHVTWSRVTPFTCHAVRCAAARTTCRAVASRDWTAERQQARKPKLRIHSSDSVLQTVTGNRRRSFTRLLGLRWSH